MRTWLPDDHLALFISDVVDALDLTEIVDKYLHLEGGHPAYHPAHDDQTPLLRILRGNPQFSAYRAEDV